jgi:hypothetical protein
VLAQVQQPIVQGHCSRHSEMQTWKYVRQCLNPSAGRVGSHVPRIGPVKQAALLCVEELPPAPV